MVMNADQAFCFATLSPLVKGPPIAVKNLNYNAANLVINFWSRDIHDQNFEVVIYLKLKMILLYLCSASLHYKVTSKNIFIPFIEKLFLKVDV